ncbi:NAD(P)H-hydrate dehydratase [Roseobacteraceae bacterium NS-SX3]
MTELLTAAQMRAIEQAAIGSGEVTGLELMERAGQGVVEAIFEEWPELADGRGAGPSRSPEYLGKDEGPRRAVVLCGPGNNGGDGFVVARLLKERSWEVEVFLYGEPDKLPPDAKVNCERWRERGSVSPLSDDQASALGAFDLVVDALFGTGLSRPIGDLKRLLSGLRGTADRNFGISPEEAPSGYPYVVSVDIPSGVCADSGKALVETGEECSALEATWAAANLTVTFHSKKLGHCLGPGPFCCGKVSVKGIGLKGSARPPVGAVPGNVVTLAAPALGSKADGHKYAHGHALVLSGGAGKTGAARLAARGALRIGAGLVTVGSPRSAMFENAAHLTAIMLRQIDGAHGVSELLEDERFNAVCLGPGLGRGADTQALVMAVLKEKRATVLDADALTRFERKPEALFEALHEMCVLTPHGGEFARLFPDLAEKLNAPAATGPAYSKVDATREAAKRAGCVVLFKGPDTVIAAPDGRCAVNPAHYERSAPWLATAGSGDVLAGFITGLLARGFSAMQAAETAAWLHVECALEFGPGLIAEDIPEQLPAVFRKLGF